MWCVSLERKRLFGIESSLLEGRSLWCLFREKSSLEVVESVLCVREVSLC